MKDERKDEGGRMKDEKAVKSDSSFILPPSSFGIPACLFIHTNTPEGKATGLMRDSVISCLVLVTVYTDTVEEVLGMLSPTMKQRLNECLKAALALS